MNWSVILLLVFNLLICYSPPAVYWLHFRALVRKDIAIGSLQRGGGWFSQAMGLRNCGSAGVTLQQSGENSMNIYKMALGLREQVL